MQRLVFSSTDDERAASELLGTVMLLGLVLGTGLGVVTLGNGLVADTQTRTQMASAESQLAGFDTAASTVAYGSVERQRFTFSLTAGRVEVDEDAGHLRVVHVNHSSGDEVLYEAPLGAVVYHTDSGEVAYQNGGIFRRDGGSVLVSPPEFHFQEQTLTLPLMPIRGSGAGTDTLRTVLSGPSAPRPIFPNASATYDGGETYANPVTDGTVQVVIQSRYYEAWADYFRDRDIATLAGVDPAARTVRVNITSSGSQGPFEMPSDGRSIDVVGYEPGHSLEAFELTLKPDQADNANFANLDWALKASEGGREFEIRFTSNGKPCNGNPVDATITYDGPESPEQTWTREDAFTENATAFSYSCEGGTPTLHANLTSATAFEFTGSAESVTLEGHAAHGEPVTYDQGDSTSVDHLTNHYLALLGRSVDLTVNDGGGGGPSGPPDHAADGSVDEGRSFGRLRYDASNVVTYLRISENTVTVEPE